MLSSVDFEVTLLLVIAPTHLAFNPFATTKLFLSIIPANTLPLADCSWGSRGIKCLPNLLLESISISSSRATKNGSLSVSFQVS